jgi:hypothetical protein
MLQHVSLEHGDVVPESILATEDNSRFAEAALQWRKASGNPPTDSLLFVHFHFTYVEH